jgi:hypothetical protein
MFIQQAARLTQAAEAEAAVEAHIQPAVMAVQVLLLLLILILFQRQHLQT